jgi:hypothetical protein
LLLLLLLLPLLLLLLLLLPLPLPLPLLPLLYVCAQTRAWLLKMVRQKTCRLPGTITARSR